MFKLTPLLRAFLLAAAVLFFITPNFLNAQTPRPPNAADKQKELLIGRWKSPEAAIEIRADNTITINGQQYTYKVKNGVITVSDDEGSMAFPYVLAGETMTVDYNGREIVYSRVKGRGGSGGLTTGTSVSESIIPEFVGKWCYMSNLTGTNSRMSSRCFVLNENGTYEYSSETSSSGAYGSSAGQEYDSGRWSATRTTLTAYSKSNGKIVYPIVLRNHPKTGDPMIVVDGDAYVTAYQKRPW
jgi:hypothetical protein